MTVKKLIEELKKYPEDDEVALEGDLAELRKVESVDADDSIKPGLVILS